MNYYNPYFYSMPNTLSTARTGLFSRLTGGSGITLGGILNGTQRALNFANQAIPLVKQVKPMIGNAKTMFRVMNEFKRTEKPIQDTTANSNVNITNNTTVNSVNNNIETEDNNVQTTSISSDNGPTFFV